MTVRNGPAPSPAVLTWVDPGERLRVEAAGSGVYRAIHHDSVDALRHGVRRAVPAAVFMSVGRQLTAQAPSVARLVREFPRVPVVALLSQVDQTTPHAVLSLGNCGIRKLVDVREPSGWHRLRDLVAREAVSNIERLALAMLRDELDGSPEDCWRFFEALFQGKNPVRTVKELAFVLNVLPSTLMSRFFRARLPSPKQYLAWARLVRVARLMENPGASIADIANQLEYSSAQSFCRHVKTMMDVTAGEFRRSHDGQAMLNRFRDELVRPHRPTLMSLRPLAGKPLGRPGGRGTGTA